MVFKIKTLEINRKMPSFVEFSSYIFNFQSIIIGPAYNFKDYIEFIDGTNILKHQVPLIFL